MRQSLYYRHLDLIPGEEGQFKVLSSYEINKIDIFKRGHRGDRGSQYLLRLEPVVRLQVVER